VPFAAIVGHAPVVTLLRRAVSSGRVPQSLILSGPDGVGKRTLALALAQALNCPKQTEGDACGACPTCLRIARGQHSDVTLVERGDEASIKIRAVRDRVLESVNYRPFEAAHRVYIIDPADEMTAEAQDALLKTLEEPPSAAVIVLVTAYPDTLLPTVRSRCRRLRVGPLVEADIIRALVGRTGVEPAVARRLAARAGGSVGRALAGQSGDFDEDRNTALALLVAAQGDAVLPRLKAATALAKHDSDRRDRDALSDRLAIVLSLLRDLGALGASGTVPLANADLDASLRKLRSAYGVDRVSSAFSSVEEASGWLGRNASPKIIADWVSLAI
jgi:DNA polymerase-3 subunit delta'